MESQIENLIAKPLEHNYKSLEEESFQEGLVSVIIPTYNMENFVGQALRSALEQTYRDIEVIVVDDGSTDNTEQVVRSFEADDSRVRYHRQENSGLPAARNNAIAISRSGKSTIFLSVVSNSTGK